MGRWLLSLTEFVISTPPTPDASSCETVALLAEVSDGRRASLVPFAGKSSSEHANVSERTYCPRRSESNMLGM